MIDGEKRYDSTVWINELTEAVVEVPPNILLGLADEMQAIPFQKTELFENLLLQIPVPNIREQVIRIYNEGMVAEPFTFTTKFTIVLRTIASTCIQMSRDKERVDLVWTGPGGQLSQIQRTEQALEDVIDAAKRELWIVSFAVYPIETFIASISSALERAVRVNLVFETCGNETGNLGLSGGECLPKSISNRSNFFAWPREKRKPNSLGFYGHLHAKCAVADDNVAFISSANLTGNAMRYNMELGVILTGGTTPRRLRKHFQSLVANGLLETL